MYVESIYSSERMAREACSEMVKRRYPSQWPMLLRICLSGVSVACATAIMTTSTLAAPTRVAVVVEPASRDMSTEDKARVARTLRVLVTAAATVGESDGPQFAFVTRDAPAAGSGDLRDAWQAVDDWVGARAREFSGAAALRRAVDWLEGGETPRLIYVGQGGGDELGGDVERALTGGRVMHLVVGDAGSGGMSTACARLKKTCDTRRLGHDPLDAAAATVSHLWSDRRVFGLGPVDQFEVPDAAVRVGVVTVGDGADVRPPQKARSKGSLLGPYAAVDGAIDARVWDDNVSGLWSIEGAAGLAVVLLPEITLAGCRVSQPQPMLTLSAWPSLRASTRRQLTLRPLSGARLPDVPAGENETFDFSAWQGSVPERVQVVPTLPGADDARHVVGPPVVCTFEPELAVRPDITLDGRGDDVRVRVGFVDLRSGDTVDAERVLDAAGDDGLRLELDGRPAAPLQLVDGAATATVSGLSTDEPHALVVPGVRSLGLLVERASHRLEADVRPGGLGVWGSGTLAALVAFVFVAFGDRLWGLLAREAARRRPPVCGRVTAKVDGVALADVELDDRTHFPLLLAGIRPIPLDGERLLLRLEVRWDLWTPRVVALVLDGQRRREVQGRLSDGVAIAADGLEVTFRAHG